MIHLVYCNTVNHYQLKLSVGMNIIQTICVPYSWKWKKHKSTVFIYLKLWILRDLQSCLDFHNFTEKLIPHVVCHLKQRTEERSLYCVYCTYTLCNLTCRQTCSLVWAKWVLLPLQEEHSSHYYWHFVIWLVGCRPWL